MKKPVNPAVAIVILLVVIGAIAWAMMSRTQYDSGMYQGMRTAKPKK